MWFVQDIWGEKEPDFFQYLKKISIPQLSNKFEGMTQLEKKKRERETDQPSDGCFK